MDVTVLYALWRMEAYGTARQNSHDMPYWHRTGLLALGQLMCARGGDVMLRSGPMLSQEAMAPATWDALREMLATHPRLPLATRLRLLTRHDAVFASYSAQVRAQERLAALPPLKSYPTTG